MTTRTTVVHCKRSKYDIYIGRPSKWGNPFALTSGADRSAVITRYEAWLRTQPQLMTALGELRGKVLGCWCAPKNCHGDVLARLADETADVQELACWCVSCEDASLLPLGFAGLLQRRFINCPSCGNKRCPKAQHHDRECTRSNATGQPGGG